MSNYGISERKASFVVGSMDVHTERYVLFLFVIYCVRRPETGLVMRQKGWAYEIQSYEDIVYTFYIFDVI